MDLKFPLSLLVISLSILAVIGAQQIDQGLKNRNVDRAIDISTQISRQRIIQNIVNSGSKSVSSVHIAFEEDKASHLSLLEVRDENQAILKTAQGEKAEFDNKGEARSYFLYRVDLERPLEPQGSIELRIEALFTHALVPYPASIAQNEKQLVRYNDNHYYFSPYTTQSQTTAVKLGSEKIESKSEQPPTSLKGDIITYGPYQDVAPFSYSRMQVHYENNSPFLTVTEMIKTIEVSHWGNLAVEDVYVLIRHDGAQLKGTFSRYDYQRNPSAAASHVPVFRQILPSGADDVYYRDEIGNISSSNFAVKERGPTLELIPRYPLFGGWSIGFYIGYNLPLQKYLFNDYNDGSVYILNTTFATTFDFAVIDKLTVKIVLPEGAKNPEVITPFAVDKKYEEKMYTYLDTSGRKVICIEKFNVVSEHDKFFQLTYNFSQVSMLQEPFLLIGAFFFFFLFIMIYLRFEFNVGPTKQRSANSDKVDEILGRWRDIMEQRTELHAALENALSKLLKTKNEKTYTTEKRQIEGSFATAKKDLLKVIAELDEAAPDISKRAREVEKKQENKLAQQLKVQENEIDYKIHKSTVKGTYEDTKTSLEKLYQNTEDELESLVGEIASDL